MKNRGNIRTFSILVQKDILYTYVFRLGMPLGAYLSKKPSVRCIRIEFFPAIIPIHHPTTAENAFVCISQSERIRILQRKTFLYVDMLFPVIHIRCRTVKLQAFLPAFLLARAEGEQEDYTIYNKVQPSHVMPISCSYSRYWWPLSSSILHIATDVHKYPHAHRLGPPQLTE